MTPFERLQARIAAVRSSGAARLPRAEKQKKVPPTGGGEIRSRTPDPSLTAKPPEAPGRVNLPAPEPGAAVLPLFKHQADAQLERPKTRGDCAGGPRPCPFAGCRHHNALEAGRTGTVKLLREPEDMPAASSCSLDVADAGEHTLEQTANILGVVRERVRQIEASALRKLAMKAPADLVPQFRKQCAAVNAHDGRRCGLLEHPPHVRHRTARGEFSHVAEPGQTRFEHQERLDAEGRRQPDDTEASR